MWMSSKYDSLLKVRLGLQRKTCTSHTLYYLGCSDFELIIHFFNVDLSRRSPCISQCTLDLNRKLQINRFNNYFQSLEKKLQDFPTEALICFPEFAQAYPIQKSNT